MNIIASSAQLPSAASQAASGVTLTAFCRDSGSALLSGVAVTFSTNGPGAINVTQGTTDAAGQAIAVLTTFGDPTNQTITVKASSGSASASLPILEVGTALQVTGVNVVGFGATANYTVKLTDSSGNGIANKSVSLASALGNSISPASATTDVNGQAVFSYKGTTGGSDTLTATSAALNATGSYTINVSNSSLAFTAPGANATSIPFNTPTTLTVQYIVNGAAVPGATVSFSTTRGVVSGGNVSASSSTTDASGNASVTIASNGADGAGGALVTATVSGGPSANLGLVFISNVPTQISVEATPTTIAPSASSVVTATVRDSSDNLVQGQTVSFALVDVTGGTLSAQSGITDQSGKASVTYHATSTTSGQNGVQISASFTSNGNKYVTPKPALITVGGQALFITLGTSNVVDVLDQTRYQLPYAVVVTDSAGNPVPNATFNLLLVSSAYQKGHLVFDTTQKAWVYDLGSLVPASDKDFNITQKLPFGCLNEDVNNNGVLDPGEDYNGNGILDPGAVATVPQTIALDTTGSAQFLITYPKDRANWVEVSLTGIAAVGGTESTASAQFVLPGVSADYTNQQVAPPGQISPYGDIASILGTGANSCQSPF